MAMLNPDEKLENVPFVPVYAHLVHLAIAHTFVFAFRLVMLLCAPFAVASRMIPSRGHQTASYPQLASY